MHVDFVNRIEDFDRLQPAWESTYAADSHAHVFCSWIWLRAWFEVCTHPWFVLAARPNATGDYTAFLPMTATPSSTHHNGQEAVLHMGAWPFADYAGFVCANRQAEEALPAFARFLQDRLPWRRLHAADVMDPRVERFLQSFSGSDYQAQHRESTACPCIHLPESWDAYLQSISSKARYHLRRCLRDITNLPDFRVTEPQYDDVERHIETLLTLWQGRWGTRTECDLDRYRHMFRRTQADGGLWLRIFWIGETPLAGLAAFIDPAQQSFYCYMTAFNPEHERLAPGKAMFAYAIQDAIAKGYRFFDLLRGGEDYKCSRLGATMRFARTTVLNRNHEFPAVLDTPLKARGRGNGSLSPVPPNGKAAMLGPGDRVRVRTLEEITRTLDRDGCCHGCAFTGPMSRFCGQELRVLKRVGRYFDECRQQMQHCDDVVLLDGARCDGQLGSQSSACDRMCMLFWRVEWLERVN